MADNLPITIQAFWTVPGGYLTGETWTCFDVTDLLSLQAWAATKPGVNLYEVEPDECRGRPTYNLERFNIEAAIDNRRAYECENPCPFRDHYANKDREAHRNALRSQGVER